MKYVALLVMSLAACTETRDAVTGTQSIEVELVSPASPGTVNARLLDSQRTIVVNLRAKNADGDVDTSFSASIRVYAQYLGTLTPSLDDMPLASVTMTNGVATNVSLDVTGAFGATTLWFDNGTGLGPDYQYGAVTGTSPTLWYRDPFVYDLQKPRDEMALDALSTTPLNDKQIRVETSRHGDRGALVVTSIFAQGYTVADVQCATGGAMPTPPCTTPPHPDTSAVGYDHAMIFTFSAPRDQYGRPINEGEVIQAFNGGLSDFNGLTEVGFPRTFIAAPDRDTPPYVNRALMPAPVTFNVSWFGPLSSAAGRINFERNEAGPISIENPDMAKKIKVCPLDDGPDGVYTKYKQWSIDPSAAGDQCDTSNVINLITAGTDFTTDPHTLVATGVKRVIGIVRPVNIGSFNVWIVYPRGKDDLQLQ